MNFTVSCDKVLASQDPQAAVTCLLTGKPNAPFTSTKTTVHRDLNLLSSCLTFRAVSVGLLRKDLWLAGNKPEKFTMAPSSHQNYTPSCIFLLAQTLQLVILIFEQLKAMNILVQCTKKQASISPSTYGYLSPCTTQHEVAFNDALQHTGDALCSSLTTFNSLFCQLSKDATPFLKTLQADSFIQRFAVQIYYP